MKKPTVILVWGGVTGIVSVIFYQILYATGMENSGLRYFSLLIFFLGLFIGTMQFRDKVNGGYLTFGKGFETGFLICLVITLISTLAFLVDLQVHPELVDKIREKAQNDMINKGYTDDQLKVAMHFTDIFTTPVMLTVSTVIGSLFMGAIFCLITAGISIKKKPFFEEANEIQES